MLFLVSKSLIFTSAPISLRWSNKNVCYKISLLLIKDMNKELILGTPFLSLLYPLTVYEEGIKTVYENQEICFYFLNTLETKELNSVNKQINLIQKKKQQIKFLGKEIHHKIIEENLLNKDIQIKVEKIKNQIIYVLFMKRLNLDIQYFLLN